MTKNQGRPSSPPGPSGTKRPDAVYANFFQIGHNAFEFLLEFGQQDARIHTRIYVNPQYARLLADLLGEAIQKYETTYGPMQVYPEKL